MLKPGSFKAYVTKTKNSTFKPRYDYISNHLLASDQGLANSARTDAKNIIADTMLTYLLDDKKTHAK